MPRVDLYFSYWIFLWYILFLFKFIHYNPSFALFGALLTNILLLVLMLYYHTKTILIIRVILMMTLLKIIPLYTLRNTSIHREDIYITLFLYSIYLVWLSFNHSLTGLYKDCTDLVLHNKNVFPGMTWLEQIGI